MTALNGSLAQLLISNDVAGWIEATKGRIYDFSKDLDRTYRDQGGQMVSNHCYVLCEMEDWRKKRAGKPTKSWTGTTENLLKNINANRYKKLDWDMAERIAHQKAVKTKIAKPKSASAKVNQNEKRRQTTMTNRAKKILPDFCAKHIASVCEMAGEYDWLEAFAELEPDQYGENVPSERLVDGSKWYRQKSVENCPEYSAIVNTGARIQKNHMLQAFEAKKLKKAHKKFANRHRTFLRVHSKYSQFMDTMSLPASPYY